MFTVVTNIARDSFTLLLEMAPYLLLGLFMAGILYIIFPRRKIEQHLGGKGLGSVVKAALFGVPLPLCSCGVVPIALSLRRRGAGRGSVISFLISTPTSGVDSILATYALMGPLFAIFRPIASFFLGIFAGQLANTVVEPEDKTGEKMPNDNSCEICPVMTEHQHSVVEKTKAMLRYGFVELVADIGKWLVIGIIIGGIISYLLPVEIVEKYLGKDVWAMLAMLVVGIPLYVCATGSIPVVAPLIAKGLNPGAALVFLIAGPATNAVAVTVVAKTLGKKGVIVYLLSIIIGSIALGFIFNYLWHLLGARIDLITGQTELLPLWLKYISSFILIALIINTMLPRQRREQEATSNEYKT